MENGGGEAYFLGFSTGNIITMSVPPPTPHSICIFGLESQRAPGAAVRGCAVAVEDCDEMW